MSEPSPAPARRPWYLRPWLHVVLSSLVAAAAQPLLKRGAPAGHGEILAIAALSSGWTWLGILAIVTSLLSWMYALRFVPLNIAFSLSAFMQVLVPIAAWLFLGETVSPKRWLGVLLVTAGVLLTVREAARVEERL